MTARYAPEALMLLVTALWGFTFVTVKDSLSQADPFSILAVRFAFGAATCVLLCRGRGFSKGLWRDGALLGVLLFLGYAFQTWGLVWTTPARSAFVTGLCVVGVPFVTYAFTRERPTVFAFLGVAMGAAGLYFLTDPGADGGISRGDGLTLACAGCYSVHIVLTGRYAKRHPALPLVAVQCVMTSVLAAAMLPFVSIRWDGSASLWASVVGTGVVASALCIGAQTWVQARTTALRAALIYSLEPLFAAGLSFGLGREVFGARAFGGGAMMILAIVVAEGGAAWFGRTQTAPKAVGHAG